MTDLERDPSSDGESAMFTSSLNNPSVNSIVERLQKCARGRFTTGTYTAACAEAATIISELQSELNALKHDIERHLGIIAEQESALSRIQAALLFWMPGVDERLDSDTRERAAEDAYLLAGYTGPLDGPCWGDEMLDRLSRIKEETIELWRTDLENAPSPCLGWCVFPAGAEVRMIWNSRDRVLRWTAHGCTQEVTHWMPLPKPPAIRSLGSTGGDSERDSTQKEGSR